MIASVPQASSDPAGAAYPSRPAAWAILATLVAATVVSYVDRTVLSLLVGPIQHRFHVGDLQVSLLLGPTFALFFAFTGVPLGWASDRTHRLRLAAAGLALWSLMTALSGLSHAFWQLFAARVGVAVGEAALLPTSVSLVADSFGPEVRTRRLSLLGMSIYWGTGLALLTGGLLIGAVQHLVATRPSLAGLEPWRAVLILVGAPGLLLAAVLAVLPEPQRRKTPPVGAAPPTRATRQEGRAAILEFAGLFLAVGLMAVVGYSLSSWAPSHLVRAYGWSPGRAGVSLGIGFLLSTTVLIASSASLADRLARRGRLDAQYVAAGALALLALPAALACGLLHDAATFVLCASVMMGCGAGCIAMGPAAVCAIAAAGRRGRAMGAYQTTVGLIGGGLGPPAVAALAHLFGGPEVGGLDGLGRALSLVTLAGFGLAALVFWSRRAAYARAALRTQAAPI